MSNNNYVRDFIDAIDAGDNINAQSNFDSEMSIRISDALQTKRMEVAKSFVNSSDIQEKYKPKKIRKKGKPESDWQKNMENYLAGAPASLAIYNSDGTITLEVTPDPNVGAIQYVDSIVKSRVEGLTHNRKTYDKIKHTDKDGNTWEFNAVDWRGTEMYKITIKPPKS
jgi:hypothetical protein